MTEIDRILDFWFGPLPREDFYPMDRAAKWFVKNPAFDAEIKEKFEDGVFLAGRGSFDGWAAFPRGRLALLILLDQFPRNIYRNTPKSFSFDEKALGLALRGIEMEHNKALPWACRPFCYLPLQHSEDAEIQKRSIAVHEQFAKDTPASFQLVAQEVLRFAKLHAEIVLRFGRFPHRNEILGRKSTPEEIEFLKQPGSSF